MFQTSLFQNFYNIIEDKLHGYTVHQQYWTLFYYQLMHIMLKNADLLKDSKLDKNADDARPIFYAGTVNQTCNF